MNRNRAAARPDAESKVPKPDSGAVATDGPNGPAQRARLTLRLEADRHLKIRVAAAHMNLSLQEIMTDALDRYLAEIKPPNLNGACNSWSDRKSIRMGRDMSYETEIDGMDDDLDVPSPAAASGPAENANGVQKKPEAALTSDVIQRGKNWTHAYLTRGKDAPDMDAASAPPISTATPVTARLLQANLSFSVPSFWSGAALFIIVYVIGFVGVLAALDLFPDLMQLMFGPQGK